MDQKICPKCGKSMNAQNFMMGLPGYIDQIPGVPTRTGDRVTTKQALPIQVYLCEACRFLELYAD
jgi:hypothetical protein